MVNLAGRRLAFKNGKAWLLVGAGLLAVLILAAALSLFRLSPPVDPDAVHILSRPIPADLLEPPAPQPAPAVNSAYQRAVEAQIASMDEEAGKPKPAPTLPVPAPATIRLRVATVNASLNIREGPSLQDRIVGAAAPNALLRASGRNGDHSWLRIETADGGAKGWVFADLTETLSGSVSSLPAVSAPTGN